VRSINVDDVANALGAHERGEISDLYKAIATQMFKVPPASVTPEQRKIAKDATYRLVYGPRGITFRELQSRLNK
jgi:DNA polymerase I-like protein with 3'-5' exonuclease and polymerase domains